MNNTTPTGYVCVERMKAAKEFKLRLHGTSGRAHYLMYPPRKSTAIPTRTLKGTFQKCQADLEAANKDGLNVAISANRIEGTQRLAGNAESIYTVFIDDDSGSAPLEQYAQLPCPPSMIVQTSPGRAQCFWLVRDCPVAQFKNFQKALAVRFDTDRSVCDPSRAVRLPGTRNYNHGVPFRSVLYVAEKPLSYKLQDLIEGLNLEVVVSVAPTSANRTAVAKATAEVTGDAPIDRSTNQTMTLDEAKVLLTKIPSEERHIWLQAGMALHDIDNSSAGKAVWDDWAKSSSKFNEEDQQRTWSNFKRGRGVTFKTLHYLAKQQEKMDEMGMAEVFAQEYSQRLKFDKQAECWYEFNGAIWVKSKRAALDSMNKLVRILTADEDGRKVYAHFRTAAAMKAVVAHAESLSHFAVNFADAADRNPDLLAVENGVVDLSTGEFRQARPDDYLTRQCDTAFDPDAECPTFLRFLKSITREDKDLRIFLRRAMGYTSSAHTREQKFFVVIGAGGNGKGVFLRTMKAVLGSYAVVIAPNTLGKAYSGNPNGPSPAIQIIRGARLIMCSETSAGFSFDEAFIKQLAGGDELTARSNYGDQETFTPVGKLWLTSNHVPDIRTDDEAMKRRLIGIPMMRRFTGNSVDTELEAKLKAEFPGILNWLIRGAKSYRDTRLGGLPTSVINTAERIRLNGDSVCAWLKSRCKRLESGKVQSQAAFDDYRKWMRTDGRTPVTIQGFKSRLSDLGLKHSRVGAGVLWKGIELKA